MQVEPVKTRSTIDLRAKLLRTPDQRSGGDASDLPTAQNVISLKKDVYEDEHNK